MAKLIGALCTSHVPAIGVAMDRGLIDEPYWQPLFAGYVPAREWLAAQKPDVVVLVFNDHATAFDLDVIPTFAIGTADSYQPATKAGARARCRSSKATANWAGISPNR